jgi:hypothetical protein
MMQELQEELALYKRIAEEAEARSASAASAAESARALAARHEAAAETEKERYEAAAEAAKSKALVQHLREVDGWADNAARERAREAEAEAARAVEAEAAAEAARLAAVEQDRREELARSAAAAAAAAIAVEAARLAAAVEQDRREELARSAAAAAAAATAADAAADGRALLKTRSFSSKTRSFRPGEQLPFAFAATTNTSTTTAAHAEIAVAECGVCMEGMGSGERVPLLLQCGHSFCRTCVAALGREEAATQYTGSSWAQCTDAESGLLFYWNEVTDESTWYNPDEPQRFVPCPNCATRTYLGHHRGVDGLPKNFALIDMLDAAAEAAKAVR